MMYPIELYKLTQLTSVDLASMYNDTGMRDNVKQHQANVSCV